MTPKRNKTGWGSGRPRPEEPPGPTTEDSPEAQARSRALRLLARREKSRAGLQQALCRAGYPEEAVRVALDGLERQGFVDDLRFCRLYLGEQSRLRPRAPRLLRHDLRREGVAPEVIDQAMRAMAEDLEEEALALAAARKKLRAAGSDPLRLRRLLEARGFGRSAVDSALKALLKDMTRQ